MRQPTIPLPEEPMTTTDLDLHRAYAAAWQATRDLLAISPDLPQRARDIVETLALILGVDDPYEDGQS